MNDKNGARVKKKNSYEWNSQKKKKKRKKELSTRDKGQGVEKRCGQNRKLILRDVGYKKGMS